MKHKIAVVIPFHHAQTGLLAASVDSVLRQTLAPELVEILVADHGSPASARAELGAALVAHQGRIRILDHADAGVGAARNKALDQVAADVQYVAFLDPGDTWLPEHLHNAAAALRMSTDVYFADCRQGGQRATAFERAGQFSPAAHPPIAGSESLYKYAGVMFDQVFGENVIAASTVVYRFRKFPRLRFREEYSQAGEAFLFWLQLAKLTNKFSLSSACECIVADQAPGAHGRDAETALLRLQNEIRCLKSLARLFPLSEAQKIDADRSVETPRRSFVSELLHRLANRQPRAKRMLLRHLKIDLPSLWLFVPMTLGRRAKPVPEHSDLA